MPVDPVLGLRSLATVARVLSGTTAMLPLLESAAEEALRAMNAASVSIGRLERDEGLVRILVNVGDLATTEDRFPSDETYLLDEWASMRALMDDGVTRVSHRDSRDCPVSEAALLTVLGKGSSVQAAIRVNGRMWGEFYATRHVGAPPFAANSVDYVDVLTAIVGASISRSMREAELVHLAFHDGLTEVLNRRGLELAAAEVFVPPDEGLRVVTVVVVDLDGLKRVNDRHGHARGDELLSAAASALEQAFLPLARSVVARVGGDEFVVLVPDHDPDLVVTIVQALCEDAGTGWGFGPEAGASAGVACVVLDEQAGTTFPELLEAADRALYQAKRHGTPDVVVSTDLCLGPATVGQKPSLRS